MSKFMAEVKKMATIPTYLFTAGIALALAGTSMAADRDAEKIRLSVDRKSGSQTVEFRSDGETVALQFDFAVKNPGQVQYVCGTELPETHVANCFVREEEGVIRVLVYSADNSLLGDATLLEISGSKGSARLGSENDSDEGRVSIGRADLLGNRAALARNDTPISGVVLSDANGKEVEHR